MSFKEDFLYDSWYQGAIIGFVLTIISIIKYGLVMNEMFYASAIFTFIFATIGHINLFIKANTEGK